jgi:protoporphyrinogen oxidase
MHNDNEPVVIIGAGPAGLAAAYELVRQGLRPLVLEQSDRLGGIARTETYNGYHFDIGGHRFFTKNEIISQLWQEMMGDDFLKVTRMSRIYYQDRFFNYPLSLISTLSNLGLVESTLIVLSYLQAKISPHPAEDTLEQWITNRFGTRLYRTFFQTYTEKVWGIPCHNIRADWAAQRVKGLSLMTAVADALFGNQKAKTLIGEFNYPRKGPGMMWQRFQQAIEAGGGEVWFNSRVVGLTGKNGSIYRVTCARKNETVEIPVGHLLSSMPLANLVALLESKPPEKVLAAARKLTYRAFLIVGLIVAKKALFPDQWIYVHSPDVRVGRIQNFKNWSAAMVPDPDKTSIGMEYFCNEGDAFWNLPDEELIDLASQELSRLGLAAIDEVTDGVVVRQPKAYPIYNNEYGSHLETVRAFTATIANLQTIGRNGMHRYNNMDHSMITGIRASQNILGAHYDLWQVNEEDAYLEEEPRPGTDRIVTEKILIKAFARMDKLALAAATGSMSGLLVFLATIWLLFKGGEAIGPNLQLLSQYFAGYTVTVKGAFIAFGYSFGWGFLFGWLIAYLRNFFLSCYAYRLKKKTESLSFRDLIDHI